MSARQQAPQNDHLNANQHVQCRDSTRDNTLDVVISRCVSNNTGAICTLSTPSQALPLSPINTHTHTHSYNVLSFHEKIPARLAPFETPHCRCTQSRLLTIVQIVGPRVSNLFFTKLLSPYKAAIYCSSRGQGIHSRGGRESEISLGFGWLTACTLHPLSRHTRTHTPTALLSQSRKDRVLKSKIGDKERGGKCPDAEEEGREECRPLSRLR